MDKEKIVLLQLNVLKLSVNASSSVLFLISLSGYAVVSPSDSVQTLLQ